MKSKVRYPFSSHPNKPSSNSNPGLMIVTPFKPKS